MDFINLSLIISAVINSGLGLLLIFHRQKGKLALIYSLNIIAILLWIWSMFFYRVSTPQHIYLWTKILYVCASFIASSFLYFTYHFPYTQKNLNLKKRFYSIFGINIVLALYVLFTTKIIAGAATRFAEENLIKFGDHYFIYVIYILGFFLYGFWRLYNRFRFSKDPKTRSQIIYLFIGYFLGANISFVSNLLLPWFGIFYFNWVGQLTGIIMVSFAVYAIFNYRLFDVRVITTEVLVYFLWFFLLFRTVAANTFEDQVLNGGVLIATILAGVFLVRSVIREVETREKIEVLANDLKKANEKLKALDKQKSEFLSFATHQLRSPLTAIKGYSSLILEGSFGKVPKKIQEPIDRIFQSTQGMVLMVNDFLNISRIEQGRMKYEFENLDLVELVEEITSEMEPVAKKSKLDLKLKIKKENIFAKADPGKLRQVIANLIDNSIKYTPEGKIEVSVFEEKNKAIIEVTDTGVGISKEEIPHLFEKFGRAKNANKVNVTGTGLGIYLAKMIVEAHQGNISVLSEGEGKGSTFRVELPKE